MLSRTATVGAATTGSRPAGGAGVDGDRFWATGGPAGRAVLRCADGDLDGAELDRRVDRRAAELGPGRLVLLSGGNDVEFVVTYLAALRVGSPVILTGADDAPRSQLEAAHDPDVVVRTGPAHRGGVEIDTRRPAPAHDLHPDLALLLSTSGSTGSPKLVRLSHENLDSNARAIASYLGLERHDVGVTSLPLHYCYGLSVLNSHLAVGASVSLTDLSVVDPCFWAAARTHGVTGLPGVPLTFELLERAGDPHLELPTLRYVTQAGGRMDPDSVGRVARAGAGRGVDLFVMYGQTEATARMAYLPPGLATSRPEAVGVPVPGARIELRPLPAAEADDWPDDVGEVVFHGPNVMLGYAESPADLARGRDIHELVTGDVARRAPDGLFEIVGRRSRFVKLCGLRIDLDRLETLLRSDGIEALCVGDDDGVLVGADADPDEVAAAAAAHLRIPVRQVRAVRLAGPPPRTAAGKPDRSALRRLLAEDRAAVQAVGVHGPAGQDGVAELFGSVLGTGPVPGDRTFVSAGGDSLSYVEASLGLEELLGSVPDGWHLRTVEELEALRRPGTGRRRFRSVETGVVLRALAVVLVVGNHMDLYRIPGGAHVLLAVAGFNLARFTVDRRHHRTGWVDRLRPVARIAVPTSLWVLLTLAAGAGTSVGAVLLVNNYVGPASLADDRWRYWFVEVLVQLLVASTLLLAVPAVRRLGRRLPLLLPWVLLVPALMVRWGWPEEATSPRFAFQTHHVAWVFLLGWAASRSRTPAQKAAVSTVAVAACAGFFGDPLRDAVLAVGLLALVWFDRVPVPTVAVRWTGAIAAASLWVYLTHYEVFPPLQRLLPDPAALVLTVAVGIAVSRVVTLVSSAVRSTVVAARPAQRPWPKVDSSRPDSAPIARAPTA